ncbi:MAG: hypothetical protein IJ917_05350 [Firmicutes bacterium]|nr:hypothetical protein [Bacillota bacterium]
MWHKVTYYEEVKEPGFLGIPRIRKEKRTMLVDEKTWKKLKRQKQDRSRSGPFTLDELIMYDMIFEDE